MSSSRSIWFRFVVAIFALTLINASILLSQEVPQLPTSAEEPAAAIDKDAAIAPMTDELFPYLSGKAEPAFEGDNLITVTSYPLTTMTSVALEDMSSGTTQLIAASQDDTVSPVTNIGFDFWYDGVRHAQFSVNPNGLARLGSTVVGTTFNNSTSGLNTTTNAPKIAPYFEDLCTGPTGKVHYKVVGSAPNRKLVVEWVDMEIPRDGSCGTGTATGVFQMWLFESAGSTSPGRIQFVYGAGINPSDDTDLGASVGLQSGAATNFASVTVTDDSVSYTVANNTNLPGIAAGKSYIFTPPVPSGAPTGLNFTSVTPLSQQLNWTDNSTNEVGFAIFRSTDGMNYSFVTQTAADAVSYNDTGLQPNTNYFYQVYAATEGAISSAATGSNSTSTPATIACNGAGGNWSDTATWAGGVVPLAVDNVTIGSGCTVTVDTASAVALSVTVDSGGTLQSPTTGTVTTNNLTVGGNLTNNGTLDFSTNGDTSGAILTFGAGLTNSAFSGTGATTDVRAIAVAKGAQSSIVEVNTTNFTVLGAATDTAGFLTLTSGTFKISGTFTVTNRVFTTAAYTIPAAGGFWLNNPNFTVAGQNGSPTNSGLLRVSDGTFNVGTASGNSMGGGAGGVFTFEGGTANFAGRLQTTSAITYNQSGGTVNVCTVGNTATTACFGLTSTTNVFNMTGGTIVLVLPNTNATPLDYSVSTSATFTASPAGTTLQLGNMSTPAATTFRVLGATPSILINTGHSMAVGSGTAGGAIFMRGSTVTNNGAIVIQGTGASSRFDWAANGPMTYTGTGAFGTAATPFAGVGMSANGGTTTINSPIFVNRINVFTGGFINSNQITLGNAGTSTTVIQVGNSTTPTVAGGFDVSPVYNSGSGGHILLHLRTTTLNRAVGFEMNPTRNLAQLTFDNNAADATLELGTGDVTISGAGAGSLALTNGVVNVGTGNTLFHNAGTATRTTGYVNGNLSRSYTATGAYTYHVGQNGYSPLLATVSTLTTNPSSLAVKANDSTMSGLNPAISVSRHWNLTETGDLTADLAFTYLDADVNGTETDYRVFKNVMGTVTNMCSGGPCVNDMTNTATVTGISDFSSWGIGENSAGTPTPGTLAFSSATYNVGEAGPMVTLTVNRTGGSSGAVNVDYTLGGGTATGGAACGGTVDYDNDGGTLMFADGETSKTFDVPICDDAVFEGNETFDATLSNPTGGATIGTPNPATVTITDNEAQPTVQFNSSTYMTTEPFAGSASGTGILITATLSGASQSTVTVDYATVAGGTATGGAACSGGGIDYVNASGTLTFLANDTSEQFFVETCVDAADEPDETVNLALSNPVGATLGMPNTAVLTIVDNDAPPGGGSPHQKEVEPNGTAATATAITGDFARVKGNVYPNADVDFFSFTGNAGDRIYAATMTSFSASASVDSQLDLIGSDGTTVIENDNDDGSFGTTSSSIAGATLPGTGTFYIRVRHNSATAQLRGYDLYFKKQSASPTSEVEPNDASGTANAVPASGHISGAMSALTDQDWFSVTLNAGDTIFASLDLDPERDATTWNGGLGVAVFNGFVLTINDASSTSPNSEAQFMTVKTAGTYYVRVAPPTGGTTFGTYNLNVSVLPAQNPPGSSCTIYTSTNVPQTIPTGPGMVSSTLTVPDNKRIESMRVLIDLDHAFMQDLDVHLRSPAMNDNGLFTDIGNATAGPPAGLGDMDIVLDDHAGIPINSFTVQAAMRWQPELNYRLDWFYGENAQGTWTLDIRDDATGDGGTLNSWGIEVCEVPAPTGTTVYSQDFEANDGGYTHSGTQDEWEYGTPNTVINSQNVITTCGSGTNCWKTDLDNTYNASSNQDLVSPNINLTGASGTITLDWAMRYSMESATFDGLWVEVIDTANAMNNRRVWQWLGATMNNTVGNPTVTISETAGWGIYRADISDFAGKTIQLKFHLDSDTTVQLAGVAIDDVSIKATGASTPGVLAFSSATYNVGEAGPMATLTVNRTGGSSGAVTVDYSLGGGTATGGAACGGSVDYDSDGGTLMFADGETSKTFDVPICEDMVFEGNETFDATLSNATGGATIGTPNPATVTITDNEMQPTVQFSAATYMTTEAVAEGGPGATITVTLSGPSQGTVSVDYATVAGGTATGGASCAAGIDFVNTSGTLMFVGGDTSETFFVPTCPDTDDEPDETVNLALTNPVGATLGMQNTAVLTIVDNDAPAGGPVTVTATAGTPGPTDYPTLKDAIDAINAGTHQGDITVSIVTSTTETATSVLNSSGAGSAMYTSVLVRPVSNGVTVAGPSLQGRGLIELNGADNVTIDGDNPNSMGVNRDLTIQNTAVNTTTFTSVIRVALATTLVNTANNNTFKNLVIKGSATGRNIAAAETTTGSENTTFGIFLGPGASTTVATNPPAAVTSVLTGVGTGATATNLSVSNNDVQTAARGISINGSATTVVPGLQISNNSVGNATAGDPDQVYAIGITAQGSTSAVISGNTVWVEGYVPSSAAGHGINVGVNSVNITGATIENNKVNRVRNNHEETFSAFGINLGGGNDHVVRNNFVSGVINSQTAGTGGFGVTFGAYGIRIAAGTGHDIYHNSVHLYGAMPGTTSTNLTAAILVSATARTGMDVRNNIFSNQISGGNPAGTRNVAVYLPSAATSAMNLTWNNNAYYVGADALNRLAQVGTVFGTGEYQAGDFDPTQTTPATNFRAYTSTLSAAGTNDNASFAQTGAPPFVSNTDLHIPAMTATRLESGGAAVGVTMDIDAEMRNATTPDIGADEFAGSPPAANDIGAVGFVVPANGSTIPTGSLTPQARFTNAGTAVQTNVTVRFKIFDSMMVEIYNQTATIPTISPLQNVVVSFPMTTIAAAGNYTMQATAELAGDQNTSNDTINGAFSTVVPIGGTINVGTGETYTSLTNPGGLFQALNIAGISGNLTVNITSDLTAETGAVMLNQLQESAPGGYTVTFKPSGAARTISGTSASNSALISLNGADRIVFDGSLSGGTDRSLTITNNQATTTTVIWIRSASAGNGANNNTIKNCIINGGPGPNSTTTAGILSGSGVTLGNDAEAPNSNNTIQNNHIYRVQNSLYLRGGAAANIDQNWVVTGNDMGSSNVNDNNIFRGMLIGNSQNFTVTNNTVQNVRSTATTTASMSGIQVALVVNGGTVTGNQITNIKNVSASGTGANGISFISTSTASNVTVANNFVSDVAANGSATVTSNGFGINVAAGAGYKFYHNSVNVNTNQASGTTAAMFVNAAVTTAGGLDVRNNIFANTQTAGATRYAFYSAAANTVYMPIDYNDYFAPAVGFIGGSARPTLADWQTGTGQDANSKAVDPLFVSATDLHLQPTSTLLGMGVSGTGITTDIDGQMRDTPPDIGADEIPAAATPGTVQFSSATYTVGESAGTVTLTVTRTSGSAGAISVNYATASGTATGGAACAAGIDFVNANGTLNWADGDSAAKTFNVTICNDAVFEPSQDFTATLSGATGGATIGTPSTATVTITDDDPAPTGTFTINDVRLFEGNAGAVNAVFTVTYSGSSAPASVQFATANGTAVAGSDYLMTSGTLNFNSPPAGPEGVPAPATQTVTVVVISDTAKEANETFFVNLSGAVNATISDAEGVGIIIDEDRPYVADFDLDRRADPSVYRPSEGVWYVLQSASDTPEIVIFGASTDVAVPGDYDGDGITDHALWRPSTGEWYRFLSGNSSKIITNWGTTGDKPVQGDYDGDGKTDLAIYRPSTGFWWILNSSNGSTTTQQFGINTDRPVQGDYDGDARTDLAVYRNGTWYITRSSDAAVQIFNWGVASDRPVSGDFDGDGRFDLAVYRDGAWWISRSLTGDTSIVNIGVATDIPVPADYDGDGTTDVGVFRPSNGDWYILRSSGGGVMGPHWGTNGDVPVPAAYLPQ